MNKDNRTDEELNRIIAEWCGWVWQDKHVEPPAAYDAHWEHKDGTWSSEIPNYCRDLNAVHEAEKKLDSEWSGRYAGEIIALGCELGVCWTTRSVASICATARQRAEALVKVIEEGRK